MEGGCLYTGYLDTLQHAPSLVKAVLRIGVRIGKSLGNKVEVSFYPASQIITFRLTADYISNSKRRELMVVDPICIKFFPLM